MEKNRLILWGAVIIGILLFLWLLTTLATRSTDGNAGGRELNENIIASEEHVKGNPDALITIVEYSDFQCPACASAYPIFAQAVTDYPDDVRLIYRHFPLRSIHPQAQLAGQAAEAAAKQGKFWDMHDALFNTQSQWSGNNNAEEFFIRLAASLGMDGEQFKANMNSSEARDAVNKDAASAASLRIQGTPTFFINNIQQRFGTYEQLKNIIEASKQL